MPREPGAWINDRYNSDYSRRQAANDDAYEAQERERREALALERRDRLFDMDAEPPIECFWDMERAERERRP